MLYAVNFKSTNQQQVNYRAVSQPRFKSADYPDDLINLQMEMEKSAIKKQKKQENLQKWNTYGTVGIAVALLGSLLLSIFSKGGMGALDKLSKEAKNINFRDVTNEKSFEQLTLSDEMKKVVEDMKTTIKRSAWLKKKGAKGGSAIMLYGEPGGGKNAYVYALTKYLDELYPGSKLIMMDVLKFKGMFNGQTENNIIGFVENVIKEAKSNPKKKYIVFLDEFDSIARKDKSANAAMSDSFQNAFKTTLTNLTSIENVQVIAATNKASKNSALDALLDDAILNRFPTKIFVPLPTKEQFKAAFVEHYKSLPQEFVDKSLTNINSSELDKICSYIVKEDHHASFRNLEYILENARRISESGTRKEGSPITIKDLEQAVKEHAMSENWIRKTPTVSGTKKPKIPFYKRVKMLFSKNS